MAIPLSADDFLSLLRAHGVPLKEVPGWKTRNRASKGPWGPVHGVLIHHTVTSDTKATVDYVKTGSAELPGPLYAGVVDKAGTVHLIGWGRCNHAGLGDNDVLQAVIAERSPLPVDNQADTDGNRSFYGFAFINEGDGKDPYTPAQLQTMALIGYIICRHHKWTERSIVAHADWQPGKPDPTPHPKIRQGVQAQVATWRKTGSPAVPGTQVPAPKPPTQPTLEGVDKYVKELEGRVADLEKWRNAHAD